MPRCAARLAGKTFPLGVIYTAMKGFCISSIIPIQVHVHFAIPPLQESGSTHARRDKTSIPFLLSYVDPGRSFEDLMKATNENPVGYSRDKENTADTLGSQQIWDPSVDKSTWSFLHGLCGLFDFPENADFLESEPLWNIQDQQQSDAVKIRFDYLFNEFELYSSRTKPQDLRNTYEIADLDITIRTYFDYAARHTPIIYLSHFNIYTISSPLLLAILAAGGQLPHSTDSPFSSLQFFDSVQDFIFDQEMLRNPYSSASQNHTLDGNVLETLQAALIMLCTEVATRDNPVSNTACKWRFYKLVTAIRALNLTKIRRYNLSIDSSNRKRFLKDEAMIRLAWMAFLLDIQFVLFFRTPPQFTIVEMTGDLPCADELYTETPDPEMELLSRSTCELPGISLSSLIDTLMQPTWSDNNHLRRVNARGLFSGICGLHSIIFSAQTTHSVPHMRPILDRALDRWRVLWDSIYEGHDTKQLEMLGFMKHALEFWVLAKELLGADPQMLQVENVDWPSKDNFSIIYRCIFKEAA
ncbi:hypothetical protein N7528_004416 [Penicillium herquei]|nr:hypothetical protein N7528_004416 [Penicillium herquei]